MRDPCLLRAPDGTFQLVWTNGWNDQTIGYASSKDLLHWSEQRAIAVMAHEPQAMNCWAPEVVYDEAKQQYVIFWSTTIPGRFPQTDGTGDGKYNHRIYSTTTKDFKTFTSTRLFFDGGFNVIDATMLRAEGKCYLIVKDETLKPVKKNLRIAVGTSPEGPFGDVSAPFTSNWVEGPSAMRIGDDYVVYFDYYTKGHYGAVRSRNLKDWKDVTSRLLFPKGARHGTVLQVPKSVVDKVSETR
jgi:beta-xylosidase